MTHDPKTIHNLGKSASSTYAQLIKVEEEFKSQVLQDPSVVRKIQQIPVSSPHKGTEFEQKFLKYLPTLTAVFSQPEETTSSDLFSFELVPSLGSYEQFEEPQKIVDSAMKKILESNPDMNDKSWQNLQKEEKTLSRFLETFHDLAKTHSEIQAQRNRFQRG